MSAPVINVRLVIVHQKGDVKDIGYTKRRRSIKCFEAMVKHREFLNDMCKCKKYVSVKTTMKHII